jgi:hypothetical protein
MGGMPGGMGGMPGGMGGMPGGMGGMPGGMGGMPGGMGGMPGGMGGMPGGEAKGKRGSTDPHSIYKDAHMRPDGGRGEGPAIGDTNFMGMPKDHKTNSKSPMAEHNRQNFDPSQKYGREHDRETSEKEAFAHKFLKIWQAYVDEPDIPLPERERRQREMDKELEVMSKTNLDQDMTEGNEGENSFKKSPFDNPDSDQEKPLDYSLITDGIELTKPMHPGPSTSTSSENLTGVVDKNNIKYIKGNVHISSHILQKLDSQRAHFLEVISKHGEPQINESNFPNLESLPAEQRRWFQEYKEVGEKLKKDLENPNYNVLKGIGLVNDIPAALCLIASMKPGVHEASQKLMNDAFGMADNNGQIPLHEMDDQKHQEHKRNYEIVEKVILDSIERCTKILALDVRENGFIEVFFFLMGKGREIHRFDYTHVCAV